MKKSYTYSNKYCVTCSQWGGDRKSSGSTVSTDADKGICNSSRSSYKKKERTGGQSCTSWEKWAEIKK